MKRKAGTMVLLAALSGCVSTGPSGPGTYMSGAFPNNTGSAPEGAHWGATLVSGAPGFMGPHGEPFMPLAPAKTPETTGEGLARATFAQSVPPGVLEQLEKDKGGRRSADLMQVSAQMPAVAPPGMMPPGMMPPGAPTGMMPPGGHMMGPMMPGAPGAIPPGAVAAVGALTGGPLCAMPVQRSSVRFVGPSGMKISWYGPTPDGKTGFGAEYLTAPGRYNFLQAAIYRLKLTDIPNRPGLDLYPTLEVVPVNNKTATFLAHSSVPVNITEEDLNQVAAGNFVVKVIYLPDPQFQDLATTGAAEIISSPLEPGVDPIAEAVRRGSILLIVRLGNILLELPNTPAMDAPPPGARSMVPGAGGLSPYGLMGNPMPGMMPPAMMPPGMMAPGRTPGVMPL